MLVKGPDFFSGICLDLYTKSQRTLVEFCPQCLVYITQLFIFYPPVLDVDCPTISQEIQYYLQGSSTWEILHQMWSPAIHSLVRVEYLAVLNHSILIHSSFSVTAFVFNCRNICCTVSLRSLQPVLGMKTINLFWTARNLGIVGVKLPVKQDINIFQENSTVGTFLKECRWPEINNPEKRMELIHVD